VAHNHKSRLNARSDSQTGPELQFWGPGAIKMWRLLSQVRNVRYDMYLFLLEEQYNVREVNV
jgi:hypothetical protein